MFPDLQEALVGGPRLLHLTLARVSLGKMIIRQRVILIAAEQALVFADGLIKLPHLQISIGEAVFRRIDIPIGFLVPLRFFEMLDSARRLAAFERHTAKLVIVESQVSSVG